MKKNVNIHEVTITALFIALGVTVPQAFHLFGMIGGQIFLPMHIPVLIGAAVLSPVYAVILGTMTPLMSSLLTGMPVLYPMGLIMFFELGTYALAVSLLRQKYNLNPYITLIMAMIAGRISAGLVVSVLFLGFGFPTNPVSFVIGAVVTGLTGIVIQLVVVPPLQHALKVLDNRFVLA